ncbi:hypothetical protein EZV73_18080 [Acidaminobacter sp. JC074]|uniref:hypothetical protein n=1 Tax=Acidaminobacter sp. JC074 TaxID=2530199 RepID=UPI001F0EC122|nr:hypothetical protein [Acidaminobacter sp. JC074]MCH4889495.1 hypothetical protein [Acidaminobacter sp. JC074]
MKKIIVICLLILSLTSISFGEIDIGTEIGSVLETDIKAYIDDQQIPSMNIDGYTAIVVEDLRYYGFDVVWHPDTRSLDISRNTSKAVDPLPVSDLDVVIGREIAKVLHTDIKTYFHNSELRSFNIDGKTAVLINDLSQLGFVHWDEEKRVISLAPYEREWVDTKDSDFSFVIKGQDAIVLNIDKKNNDFYFNEVLVGFQDVQAMLSLEKIAAALDYKLVDDRYTRGAYGFELNEVDQSVNHYYDGLLVETSKLNFDMITKETIYISDGDLAEIFGLYKTWDPESERIILNDHNEIIEDHGNLHISGRNVSIKVLTDYWVGYNYEIRNTSHDLYGGGSSLTDSNQSSYAYITSGSLLAGKNDVEVTIKAGHRILMHKVYKDLLPDYTTHILENEKNISAFSYIRLDSPDKGYYDLDENNFTLKGEIFNSKGDIEISISKQNDLDFEEVSRQTLTVIEGDFNDQISFGGTGLYKVVAKGIVKGIHENYSTDLFEFYIRLK